MWKHLLCGFLLYLNFASSLKDEEVKVQDFINKINVRMLNLTNKNIEASWNYETNLTEANLQKQIKMNGETSEVSKQIAKQVNQYNWTNFKDYSLRKQFKLYSDLGIYALPKEKIEELENTTGTMNNIFSTAKICNYHNKNKCDMALEPDIEAILAKSTDPDELKYYWLAFRNAVGPKCKQLYEKYVALSNEAARLNDMADNGDYWLDDYEDNRIKEKLEKLFLEIKPFYEELHAYVRYHLRKKYGNVVSERGPIPAHLLGNMWAQEWLNIYNLTRPFKMENEFDLTTELRKQNYTVHRIQRLAEHFFHSINLSNMTNTYWKKSVFVKPENRNMVCHPSAWDFYKKNDFRVKMCAEVTDAFFETIHHEMGHIEYFMQYQDLPLKLRAGANEGFHESIGDLIAISASTQSYFRDVGLVHSLNEDNRTIINNLFKTALKRLAFLPFGYLIDKWRWDIFGGKIQPQNYNCEWWKIREKYQGIEPPINRSEADFDAAAKFHVIADVPYIRYFVSHILQFQFHRGLCQIAGQYEKDNPDKQLHKCNIYKNVKAGNVLKKMLSMGAAKPWNDALKVVTDQREMDASAMLEYFKPLIDWLREENKRNGVFVGWENSTKVCSDDHTNITKATHGTSSTFMVSPGYITAYIFVSILFFVF